MSEKPRPRSPKTTRKPVKAGVTRSKAVKGSAVAPTDPHKRRGQWHASGAIVRNRLLEALDTDPRARLIVVQAPAGYGKSSLLRQHCNRCAEAGEKVAWVRMDSQSSDPGHFLRLLCEAVEGLDIPPRKRGSKSPQRAATLQDLLRSLSAISVPVVLVVDNFETAAVPEFEAVFAQVVRSLPESVQLCVGTRVLPTARLARLQIRDGTVIVSNEELCFRPAETREFFAEFKSLNPVEIAQIHERTDGWPAALQAYRLCLRRGARFRMEAWAGKGITRELMDFLAAEMFDQLAPALGLLLLELAVPEKLSAELVEYITGESRGAERLAEIERAGLFLGQADLGGNWLRFHNLFRQFLLDRAGKTYSASDIALRHRRIAQWYADHEMTESAIAHWIEGGDSRRAADLLAEVIDSLVAQERLGLIESYADRLSPEALLRHDNLVRGAVIAYGFRRAFDKAESLLAQHRAMLEAAKADQNTFGLHNFSRLFLLAAQDKIEELGTIAVEAASQLSDKSSSSIGITLNAGSVLVAGEGRFDEARNMMLQARPLHDRVDSLFGRAYCDAIYSLCLCGEGRIDDAQRHLDDALRQTERRSLSSVSAGSVTAAYLVSCLYEQDRLEEAQSVIRDYAPLVDQQTIVDAVATMGVHRARIACKSDARGEAEEVLERMLYLGYRHGLDRLVIYAHAELGRQATLDGDLGQAQRWLMELPPQFREESGLSLMFHAGESEACTVTWARWLIRAERSAEAVKLLAVEIRRAKTEGRRRRELKLHLMHALALSAEGKVRLAGRSLLEALEIGARGGFVRSFLDEQELAIALLLQLKQQQDESLRAPEADPVMRYLDRLLIAGGEGVNTNAQASTTEAEDDSAALIETLTKGEKKMLHFVAAGLSNKDLADRLSVSVNTVKWHLRNVFEKLQVKNRLQATVLARRHGLIK